ncbi:putative LuxR-family transcriptional regulator [Actinoplanes missouriensis 431]|uniref:Putative LuxR-family transcriptional regulator n=1 Tax=Actinoplanes missouriensis (strain ATCC 14538 / DSM 43046 / CBS 188.64 / JCM 3121 / NBRC 102363 / NCIMB 12654 / NRRL B-3342 / UNCC 431) TaxID=512565 RepID=I0H9X2_ACTM4|nr:putative LuxR-family transcriptional regulator [Actinoplanes missouriensis 431]
MWAELSAILDPSRPETTIALLTGPAGIGKTALLSAFTGEAVRRGLPTIRYGDLSSLVGVKHSDSEPGAALDPGPGTDPLALRAALFAEVTRRAGDRLVVLVADDADRLDPCAADLLTALAAAIVWRQVPALALVTARTDRAPADLADLIPAIPVPPLTDREAERLLDRLPGAPRGTARVGLLRRAAGNPLALREFAPGPSHDYDQRIRALPALTLRALTLVAAGEPDLSVIARADPAATLAAWQPAEEAGLVVVAGGTARFTHPLAEQAVLAAAGPGALHHAHQDLAAVTTDPHRALWHRAAVATGTDPELAAELIAAAGRLGGTAATTAVSLLDRAAALSPASRRAAVLLEAAGRAGAVGRMAWAAEIVDRARAALLPGTPAQLTATVAALSSWLLTMRGRVHEAANVLVAALHAADDRATVTTVAATAGLPAFLLGEGPLTDVLRAALTAAPAPRAAATPGPPAPEPHAATTPAPPEPHAATTPAPPEPHAAATPPLDPASLYPLAVVAPDERVRAAVLDIPAPAEPAQIGPVSAIGGAALLLDEPEHALRLLEPAATAVARGAATGVFLSAPGGACWALIDLGRWVEGEQLLVPVLSSPVSAEAVSVRGWAYTQLAVIALHRGHRDQAADLLRRSEHEGLPALAVRVRQAQAQAAAAAGDHESAYRLLSDVLTGTHFWELLLLPDVVAAAMHIGLGEQAATRCAHVRDRFAGRWLTARQRTLIAAGDALADPDPAAAADRLAPLVDAAETRRRPFERAVLAVELADRWRRSARARRATEMLVDALDTFERLGASGWAARVRADLRTPATAATAADPFAALSAQQQQIARLAAEGLTNREIAARLFLSPRTVASHLYRMFPQLGVSNRTQLADLLSSHLTDDRAAGGGQDLTRPTDGRAP